MEAVIHAGDVFSYGLSLVAHAAQFFMGSFILGCGRRRNAATLAPKRAKTP